ncbi:hypothetical protein [Gaopeijia maritima]|uniref:Lipoprotein n=1 Tax=Gaopeijia maritima TaxID=3119007 RepID=A0ABU9EB25_9BACT
MKRRSMGLVALAAVLSAGGCSMVGSPGATGSPAPPLDETPPPAAMAPEVQGRWTGFMSVEGQGLNGTLDLAQDGHDLQAVFEAPDFGMIAEGPGSVDPEGRVVIRLTYNLQCEGTAELVGRRSSDGVVIDGTLTASDCTGSSEGSFSFRR